MKCYFCGVGRVSGAIPVKVKNGGVVYFMACERCINEWEAEKLKG